jgi:hypothetical protein
MKGKYFYSKVMTKLLQRSVAFTLIITFAFSILTINIPKTKSALASGVDITYEVTVVNPPNASVSVVATYKNITSPLRLEISFPNFPSPTLEVFKEMQFLSSDGQLLNCKKIDNRTIEVYTKENLVFAKYSVNLDVSKAYGRDTKVGGIGGVVNGLSSLPVPSTQKVNSAKVKFIVPEPWKVVSTYPEENGWFLIKPYTYEDLALETLISGWYFGNIDFDYTKTYDDGFEIRVVGFKYFDYEHWNVYLGDTSLEEAVKTADFYHKSYEKIKEIYGEFPFPKLLLIGPGYWQAGNTHLKEQLVGWYRYEYIPHHLLHAFFGIEGSRIILSQYFYMLLREGYPTYSEGIMTAEIENNPIWRGMLYERKFHYLRGKNYNNLEQNSRQYVLGFIVTYLMDKEIRKETNNQKNIHDLMVRIWKKYKTPNMSYVPDEPVLDTLKEITGKDWHWFYDRYVKDTNNLDVNQLDDLKEDFKEFLKVISDYWYNGCPSMYFIGQEIVSAAGDFDMNVRMQLPMHMSPNIENFALIAHKYKDVTKSNLTEEDIENILHQITGKDHSDFFEFYRSQGFEVDPKEITEYVRTFTHVIGWGDNAVRLIPNTFPIGRSTNVIGEIVDQDFANSTELLLQVQVYEKPIGLNDIADLVTGKGVSYKGSQEFSGGDLGNGANHFFKLPLIKIGDKVYTFFTINLSQDAGIMNFTFNVKTAEPEYGDWLGGFIGTKKVFFQSPSTFNFKPNSYNAIDTSPPVFSITDPTSSEISTEINSFCIKGLVEPEAKVLVNGNEATISNTSFEFSACVNLQPGDNIVKVEAIDKAGNTTTKEIKITLIDTTPPEILINSPNDNFKSNENTIIVSGTVLDKESGINKVTVSGNEISLSPYGSFSYTVKLVEGDNKINIIASDKAGNQTTKTLSVIYEKPVQQTVIILQIGNQNFTVNGVQNTLDSPPVIKNNRTLLPIRAIVEALGGTIEWIPTTKSITIRLGSTYIGMQIGNSTAVVNGYVMNIDPDNPKAVPEIINSRTMLPLRFVAEKLGCDVQWDGNTKTITITYPKS